MWVKICGVTRLEDALFVEQMGADALGFVFAPSPRKLEVAKAKQIGDQTNYIEKVGVFVNQSLADVKSIRAQCKLDIIQLHGDESPEFCRAIGGRVIKALRFKDIYTVARVKDYPMAWKILLDAYVPEKLGGTGRQIRDELLSEIVDYSNVILAGGIHSENIATLWQKFQPFGIDISSGVESSPGIKDHSKLRQLFLAIQELR